MGDIWAYVHLKHLQTALCLRLDCIRDSKAVCLKLEYTKNCQQVWVVKSENLEVLF